MTGLGLFHPGSFSWATQTNYKSIVCIFSSGSSHLYRSHTTDVTGASHQSWSLIYYWCPSSPKESHQTHLTYYLRAKLSRYLTRGITIRASNHIILWDDDAVPMLCMRSLTFCRQHSRVYHSKPLFESTCLFDFPTHRPLSNNVCP